MVKWGRRRADDQPYQKRRSGTSASRAKLGRYVPPVPPTRKYPVFIFDENLPKYAAREFRLMGYEVDDVREIPELGRGTKDETIKNLAEQENFVVITRDGPSFPEPKWGGDRIVVPDTPKQNTTQEILMRMKQVHMDRPKYPPIKTLTFGDGHRIAKAIVIDIDHRRGVALLSIKNTLPLKKTEYGYFIGVFSKRKNKWVASGSKDFYPGGLKRTESRFHIRRFKGK